MSYSDGGRVGDRLGGRRQARVYSFRPQCLPSTSGKGCLEAVAVREQCIQIVPVQKGWCSPDGEDVRGVPTYSRDDACSGEESVEQPIYTERMVNSELGEGQRKEPHTHVASRDREATRHYTALRATIAIWPRLVCASILRLHPGPCLLELRAPPLAGAALASAQG